MYKATVKPRSLIMLPHIATPLKIILKSIVFFYDQSVQGAVPQQNSRTVQHFHHKTGKSGTPKQGYCQAQTRLPIRLSKTGVAFLLLHLNNVHVHVQHPGLSFRNVPQHVGRFLPRRFDHASKNRAGVLLVLVQQVQGLK